jgi:DNA-binding transcriptional LysR family regulator
MRANEFAELSAFAAIAEERSFRRAATRLNLRPSTLSHTLRALEERLGVQLLYRTTRTVSLTEAGIVLLRKVAPALASLTEAVEGLNRFRTRPQGVVRLNVPDTAATLVLAPKLGAIASAYPDVSLEITIDNGFIDIVRERFDAGIRLGNSVEGGMAAVRVSRDLRGAVVASPQYWEGRTIPDHPKDLLDQRCIGRRYGAGRDLHRWEFERDGENIRVAIEGMLILDNDDLMHRAALDGVGIAMLEEGRVADDITQRRLVRVLDEWCPPITGFYLYHSSTKVVAAALAAVIEALRADD